MPDREVKTIKDLGVEMITFEKYNLNEGSIDFLERIEFKERLRKKINRICKSDWDFVRVIYIVVNKNLKISLILFSLQFLWTNKK